MRKSSTHDGRFKQLQVWNYLKEQKGASPKQIATLLNTSRSAIGHMLRRMVKRGNIYAEGSTHLRIYKARRIEPKDCRGRHSQAAFNLRHGPQACAVAKAKSKGRLYVPPPKHALDEAMRLWK